MNQESRSAQPGRLDELDEPAGLDEALGGMEAIVQRAAEFIRERPIAALLVAAGAGFLLGRLLRA